MTHTSRYLTTNQIADIFFDVTDSNNPCELIETEAHGVVSFIAYQPVVRVSILRLHNLLTNKDPLIEFYVNGRQHSPSMI